MKLPEPVAYLYVPSYTCGGVVRPSVSAAKYQEPDGYVETINLYGENQLREALAQQESVMRQALYVISAWDRGCEHDDYWRDCEEAIKALEAALK